MNQCKYSITTFTVIPFNNYHLLPSNSIVHNSNWFEDIKLLDFLSEIGSSIKVRNLARKSFVEDRSKNLTFSQFTYQVIQGYDWLRLYDKHDCRFQVR